jgi:RNA polymerase sigma factor (sigma-70 family)
MGAAHSDAQLVALCRANDVQAWAELVERFSRYVHAIVTRGYRLGEADAEDVFQEVFARTYQHLDRLRDDEAIRPWIAQLTRRLCVDRLRAAGRESPESEEVFERAELDDRLERLEEAVVVRDALAELSDDCREILDRFFARDETYRMIAAALQIPMGTAASRISRCLTRLRAILEGRNRTAGPSSE